MAGVQFVPIRHYEWLACYPGADRIVAAELIPAGVGIDHYPLYYNIAGQSEVKHFHQYKVQLRAYLLPLYENESPPASLGAIKDILDARILKMKDSDPEAYFTGDAGDAKQVTQADIQLGTTQDESQIWKLHRSSLNILTDSIQNVNLLKKQVIRMGNAYAGRSQRDAGGKIYYSAQGDVSLPGGVMPMQTESVLCWYLLMPPDVSDDETEIADMFPAEWEDLAFLRLRRDWLGNIENLTSMSKNKVAKWLDHYLIEDGEKRSAAASLVAAAAGSDVRGDSFERMTYAAPLSIVMETQPSFMQQVQGKPVISPNAGN